MIAELAAGVAGAAAIAGWIYAYRARGEARSALELANREAERARLAEVARDAADAKASDAIADAAACDVELRAERAALTATRAELIDERRKNATLLEKLAKAGAPVGPVLLDSTVDRLYADKDRRGSQGRDPNGDADDSGRKVSDDPPRPPDDKTRPK